MTNLFVEPPNLGELKISLSNESIYCVADLHLEVQRPDEIMAFANEVLNQRGKSTVFLILGDLFNVYVGFEDLRNKIYAPLWEAFESFSERGRVILLRGNRDVLLEPRDASAFSFEVADFLLHDEAGSRVLYVHGDAYCVDDISYQRLRRLLRNKCLRLFLRFLPSWLRGALGRHMRKVSVAEKRHKEPLSMAFSEPSMLASLKFYECDNLVVGHVHVEQERQLSDTNCLKVLPAWTP